MADIAEFPNNEETKPIILAAILPPAMPPQSVLSLSIETTCIKLRWEHIVRCRAMKDEVLSRFLLVSFKRLQFSSHKRTSKYITEVLCRGITINGAIYHFYGHSNSQLKSRSCLMYQGTVKDIETKLAGFGNLDQITHVGKRAKRIGLLFSSCHPIMDVSTSSFEIIEDIIGTNGQNFTDGCGLVFQ